MSHHLEVVNLLICGALLSCQTWIGTFWKLEWVSVEKLDFDVQAWVKSLQVIDSLSQEQRTQAEQLYETGQIYYYQENYALALHFYQQALQIYKEIGDSSGELNCLYGIGVLHQRQGNHQQALKTYQQTLAISLEIVDIDMEWTTLTNMGSVYAELGQYNQALNAHQQALAIVQRLGDPLDKQIVLNNLGLVYSYLGQEEQSLIFYQQALLLNHQAETTSIEEQFIQNLSRSSILHNIGLSYVQLKEYSRAIESFQQALEIQRETGERSGEAEILNNLAIIHNRLGQPDLALPFLEQALTIFQELGDRNGIAYTLDTSGTIYTNLGQADHAWEVYQEALSILIEISDRAEQRLTLSNIADLLLQQNQPELAIIFYKRSVNVTESIRRGIQGLPVEQQQSYTNTVADTYRKLADLLLQQDRVLEAQQVLDLLKVQEVQDYLRRGVRGSEQTAQGVDLLPQERSVSDQFDAGLDQAIALGRELTELEAISQENRTVEQQQRVIELRQIQQNVQLAFTDFLSQTEVQAAIRKLRQTPEAQNIEPASLTLLRQNLQNLQQDAVLLYPLILEDRLELVLLSPDAPPIHRSVPVGRVRLNQAISEMLTALKDPDSDATVPAQQLYDWLIRPIEADLKQANAQTILYAPDGQLRYLPLAALHDGQQWLVEQYRVNHITALSLYNLTAQPQTQPNVLAAAFGEGRFNVQRGAFRYPFSGLPFAKAEIETLASLFPDTTQLIDRAFNRDAILLQLNDYKIVHLATHAQFVTGQPEDSFIVLGDGDSLTLREMDGLSLTNVDLIVLSACETAVSLGDGKEILGFGYQIQQAGARAAIASLWAVDDGGTQVLMSHFYDLLRQGNLTKTAALQQAQIALIAQKPAPTAQAITQRQVGDPEAPTAEALAHPYYWAPFILIGNGL